MKRWIVLLVGLVLAGFTLYTSATTPLQPTLQRGVFLLILIVLTPLKFPSRSKLFDYALIVIGVIPVLYLILNWEELAYRAQYEPAVHEYLFGFAVILVVLELTRRTAGLPLSIVAAVAILYARFGNYLPDQFAHRGYSVERLLANQYLTHEGLFGSILGTAATIITAFVLFGCFLQFCGVADLLMAVSVKLTRGTHGGPAKLAVIASALFGTISGSSSSNVVTTGTTTIPLMKRAGYAPSFAGAVEAVASTGGQIMPPVMGVAAFLMAEVTGIPYITIAIAAALPALLYYAAVFFEVDLEARRLSLKNVEARNLQVSAQWMLARLPLLLPFAVLLYLLLAMYSPSKAAFWSTLAVIVVSGLRRETRLDWSKFLEVINGFVTSISGVALACATAGIVIGALNITGGPLRISYALADLAEGNRWLLLFFVMILCIILGMGLPTPAAYAVVAAFAAPMIIATGVTKLAAHLFAFYYACISSITPPVAIAAYAAAGIAGSAPMRTGWMACKIGLAAFIVPFMFANGPALLIGQAPLMASAIAFVSALVGVWFLSLAVIGYFRGAMRMYERVGYLVAALLLMDVGIRTDFVGMVLGGLLLTSHIVRYKRIAPSVAAEPLGPSVAK